MGTGFPVRMMKKFWKQIVVMVEQHREYTSCHWLIALKNTVKMGHLGGSVGSASDFGSGHDLMVCGFKPHVRLYADSTEPAWDSLSLSLSLSLKNKH